MRRSIATVSMSGTLREKLEAIAAARFDGFELFEPDLINFNGTAREIGTLAADLGLTCDLYQPFRDFEGAPDAVFKRNLERAERKFDVMNDVGAQLMLVCSNTQPNVLPEEERAAEQLYALAERAAMRNLRIGFEALAWGRKTNLFGQAWSIVKRANHPHLGLILDSFHTLSLNDEGHRKGTWQAARARRWGLAHCANDLFPFCARVVTSSYRMALTCRSPRSTRRSARPPRSVSSIMSTSRRISRRETRFPTLSIATGPPKRSGGC